MAEWRRFLATSDHLSARAVRTTRRALMGFSLPAPRVLVRPLLWVFLAVREVYYFVARVFVCEPFFKAHCTSHGSRVHTGVHLHWIQGKGRLAVGSDVHLHGRSSFAFAARFSDERELSIGDHTIIGHNCSFVVGRRISIGKRCLLANNVRLSDSPGHPSHPAKRRAGLPPDPEQVRPILIGDNVWIGAGAVVLPGVSIGENSIVATGAVVTRDVPPNKVVMGNPARVISFLPRGPA